MLLYSLLATWTCSPTSSARKYSDLAASVHCIGIDPWLLMSKHGTDRIPHMLAPILQVQHRDEDGVFSHFRHHLLPHAIPQGHQSHL